MRVNSSEAIKLGESIHEEFGSWDKARKAAQLRGDVYVLPAKSEAKPALERKPRR
jgi:hypothetical protein